MENGKFVFYLSPTERTGLRLILDRWIEDHASTPWAQTLQEALRIRAQIQPLTKEQQALVRSRY